jgi:GTP-binding protein Era
VFVDTPGVHKPGDALNRRMMQEVQEALVSCDLVLLMIDVSQKFGTGDEFVLDLVKRSKAKAFLLLNKVDLIEKGKLLPMIEQYSKLHSFAEVIPVSAAKQQGLDELLTAVANALPEGPKYFPEDQITDQPERFVVAELIREQVLVKTKEEVPYASGVIVERFEDGEKLVKIAAAIFVEREGQKGIIIGKQGTMLKSIGTHARLQIERFLGKKVFLELFVKVREGWRNSARAVDEAVDWRRQIEDLAPKKIDRE